MNQRLAKLSGKFARVGMAILFSFLTFFIFFPEDHNASAGRTLVIHNNTNATLFVHNSTRWMRIYSQAAKEGKPLPDKDWKRIPPLSKKSLFNYLDKNNNHIIFDPKFVRPKLTTRYRAVYVTGEETSPKELNIFASEWGKKFMSDAPGASK